MNELLARAFLIAASFMFGAIPFGYLIAKQWYQTDITKVGSGNIGAANLLRTLGVFPFILTLALDALKGYVPVITGIHLYGDVLTWPCVFGLAAILGHTTNPFLGWKGGKGVATALGVFLALTPTALAIGFAVFCIVLALTRYVSLGSLTAAATLAIASFILYPYTIVRGLAVAALVIIIVRHRENIKRLIQGNEHKASFPFLKKK